MGSVFFLHFLQSMYAGSPWYVGQVWGNVFVVAIVGPLGWLWAKTKFWPLAPIKAHLEALHARHQEHADALSRLEGMVADLHRKHDELARRAGIPEPTGTPPARTPARGDGVDEAHPPGV